jgi:PKD repeat protein
MNSTLVRHRFRVWAGVLAAAIVAITVAVPVQSATVTIGSTNVINGATVAVPVTINNTSGALGDYAVTVSFDTNVVRFSGVSGGQGQFAAAPSVVTTNIPGQVRYVHQQTVSITAPTGTVLVSQLSFTAIGTSGSSSTLKLSNVSADNTDGQALPVSGLTDGAVQVGSAVVAPVAAFGADQTAGALPLPVNFTDTSSGIITSRTWDFGDGVTTNIGSGIVSHTYTQAGSYSVSLTVAGPGGTNTLNKSNYITVTNVVVTTYTITASASPSAGGSVSGGGLKTAGTTVTLIATANAGYNFVNWTEGATEVSTSANYSFTANANRTLVANFTPVVYTISTSASPSAGGTTSGGGSYTAGAMATVTASANSGYSFANWTEGGTTVSSSPSYVFTVSANRTLVANFTVGPDTNSTVQITLAPTVTNALLQTENTVVVVAEETNLFTVGAVSSTGHAVFYKWQFGDGTNTSRSLLNKATHIYSTDCGSYTAGVTVDDGTSTNSANLTVSVACALEVTKLQLKPSFARPDRDSCSLAGMVDLGAGSSPFGRPVTVGIGGAQVSFVLDAKGKAKNSWGTCGLKFDKKTGLWKISVKLKNGNWQTAWAQAGLLNSDVPKPGVPVTLTLVVLVDTEGFAADKTLLYTARTGKSGSAK